MNLNGILKIKEQIEVIAPPLYYAVTDIQEAGAITHFLKSEHNEKEAIIVNPDDWPKIKDQFGDRQLISLKPKDHNQ